MLMADEVYQENIYCDKPFVSLKKVLSLPLCLSRSLSPPLSRAARSLISYTCARLLPLDSLMTNLFPAQQCVWHTEAEYENFELLRLN